MVIFRLNSVEDPNVGMWARHSKLKLHTKLLYASSLNIFTQIFMCSDNNLNIFLPLESHILKQNASLPS